MILLLKAGVKNITFLLDICFENPMKSPVRGTTLTQTLELIDYYKLEQKILVFKFIKFLVVLIWYWQIYPECLIRKKQTVIAF